MQKLLSILTAGLLFVASMTVCAEQMTGKEKPGAIAGGLLALTATVEAIDLDKRLVTLKGPEEEISVNYGDIGDGCGYRACLKEFLKYDRLLGT